MPRHRMVAPINTVKHYVTQVDVVIATGVILNHAAINAVVAPATANTNEVREGAIVKAIYIERWLSGDEATVPSQFVLTVEKKRVTELAMTFAQSLVLQAYPNKKNILYTTQGVLTTTKLGGNTVPVIRQYILIPKGKQRFGLGDQLFVNIAFVTSGHACGIETYKEYV